MSNLNKKNESQPTNIKFFSLFENHLHKTVIQLVLKIRNGASRTDVRYSKSKYFECKFQASVHE